MGTQANPSVIDYLKIERCLDLHHLDYAPTITNTTLNGILILTTDSTTAQLLEGSATGFSVKLPDAMTLELMRHYIIFNNTNQTVSIKDNSNTEIFVISQKSFSYIYLKDMTTANGIWLSWQVLMSSVASGIISYNLPASTPFTTSSTTDVIITNFNLTPQAGTYAIWYNSDNNATQNNATVTQTIYKNGVAITDSVRRTQSVSANFIFQQTSMTIAQFNGTDSCNIRVKTNQGSLTVNGRSLLLIRLGT